MMTTMTKTTLPRTILCQLLGRTGKRAEVLVRSVSRWPTEVVSKELAMTAMRQPPFLTGTGREVPARSVSLCPLETTAKVVTAHWIPAPTEIRPAGSVSSGPVEPTVECPVKRVASAVIAMPVLIAPEPPPLHRQSISISLVGNLVVSRATAYREVSRRRNGHRSNRPIRPLLGRRFSPSAVASRPSRLAALHKR